MKETTCVFDALELYATTLLLLIRRREFAVTSYLASLFNLLSLHFDFTASRILRRPLLVLSPNTCYRFISCDFFKTCTYRHLFCHAVACVVSQLASLKFLVAFTISAIAANHGLITCNNILIVRCPTSQ